MHSLPPHQADAPLGVNVGVVDRGHELELQGEGWKKRKSKVKQREQPVSGGPEGSAPPELQAR